METNSTLLIKYNFCYFILYLGHSKKKTKNLYAVEFFSSQVLAKRPALNESRQMTGNKRERCHSGRVAWAHVHSYIHTCCVCSESKRSEKDREFVFIMFAWMCVWESETSMQSDGAASCLIANSNKSKQCSLKLFLFSVIINVKNCNI